MDAADGGDGSTGSISISISNLTVFVGAEPDLDASGTTAPSGQVAFAWTVTRVPAGSAIASANLVGATTATPSFVPDVAGDYALVLVASSGGAPATRSVTVTAISPAVLYYRIDLADAGDGSSTSTTNLYVTSVDGTAKHPFVCPNQNGGSGLILLEVGARDFTDFFEAPPGQPARFAAGSLAANAAGSPLWIGAAEASCNALPAAVLDPSDASRRGRSSRRPTRPRDAGPLYGVPGGSRRASSSPSATVRSSLRTA